ncbi:protein of unknown function [Chitinophaga costaii]|uniref:DUF4843 domain-containing protein n=1 Tax=Chitinophaga costaii TaxID=1335309 RepID=A0A1C4ELG8_9BACT|nr:DUF4843 domain-containing protein [Chitinophaga costaii]SCC44495.1 protein of unknown function [Chitinophaga costaii]
MNKKITHMGALLLTILLCGSCKKDMPGVYSGQQFLEFYYDNDIKAVTAGYSTFFYKDPSVQYDTVLFHVRAVGTVPNKDSYIKFTAFADTSASPAYPDAVAGVHYVPFDNAALKLLWKIDADSFQAYVPIITIRDTSLKTSTYQLHFKIDQSDDFAPGNSNHTEGIVYISDRLSKPSNWTASFFLGTYGPVKHQFLIDQSGDRWDADFIATIGSNTSLQAYYLFKFTQALKAVNAARLAAGQTELREDPALATSAVTFPPL